MRNTLRLALVGVIAVGTLGVGASVASAADSNCPLGAACAFDGYAYSGPTVVTAYNNTNLWGTSYNDDASSAAANGRNCKYSRFYADTTYSSGGSGPYFTLYSKYKLGYNYQDPDLSNGAGYNGSGNWDNRVSAIEFAGC